MTKEDLTLYRVYGNTSISFKEGRFATTEQPTDRMTSKLDSALTTDWKNSREYYCEVYVPAGTVLNIGKVEEQPVYGKESGDKVTRDESSERLPGGADQVLLPEGFDENKSNYGEEHQLDFAGNYHEFEQKLKNMGLD